MRFAFTTPVLVTAFVAGGAAGVCACSSPGSEAVTLLSEDATDTNEVETQASSLTAALTLPQVGTAPSVTSLDGPTLFQVAENAQAYFLPSGANACLGITKDTASATVTYTFTRCVGVWGLSLVNGTITVAFTTTSQPDGTQAATLTVNGSISLRRGDVTYDNAVATITANGLKRAMTWDGKVTGTTARGRAFSHTAHWDAAWTLGVNACVELSGNASGTVGAREIDTTVTSYQRCKGECPVAGGVIDVTEEPSGTKLEIDFNGTADVSFSVNGVAHPLVLACGI